MGSPTAREDGTAHRGVIASTAGPARRAVAVARPPASAPLGATGSAFAGSQARLRAVGLVSDQRTSPAPRLARRPRGGPAAAWTQAAGGDAAPAAARAPGRPPGRRRTHRAGHDGRTRGLHRRRCLLGSRLRVADLDRRSDDDWARRDDPGSRCDAEAADRLLRRRTRGDRRPRLRRRERTDPPRGEDRRRRDRRCRQRRPPRRGAGHGRDGQSGRGGRHDRRAHRAPRGRAARAPALCARRHCPTRSSDERIRTALGAGRGYVD